MNLVPRTLLLAALAAATLAACASTGAVPQPFPGAGGTARRRPAEPVPTPGEQTPGPGAPASPPGAPPAPGRPATADEVDGYALSTTALSLRGAPSGGGKRAT